ncbi:MAG: nuclear transport factor 2 family protein [Dehalococcoidia bacterium]|nr:nuclear transport factor 2 family protein [Dehalococcoidia bacterium]
MEDLRSTLNRLGKRLEGDVGRIESKIEGLMKLPDRFEIENLIKTMAWAMDSGDRDLWFSIWADDIHYIVPQYQLDIRGKEAMKEFGEISIFTREERRFSALTNIMVDVKGDTATGKDYYMHYGYAIDHETGKVAEERTLSEGMHFYRFKKLDGSWKIAELEVRLHRRQEPGS